MTEAPAVRAEGLSVRFGDRVLFEGASFALAPGEILLLAGPSGAGKTTLLRLLAGLLTRHSPGLRVEGRLDVRGRVGVVFQDHALFEGLTGAQNVAFALAHRSPPGKPEEAGPLLVGLDVPGDVRVDRLSGGQRQRVAIARTLASAPDVIAWDEPTSGLDPALADRVRERIRETARRGGTTTIVVTHDVAGLVGIADRVLLLDPVARTLAEVEPGAAAAALAGLSVPPARKARRAGGGLGRGLLGFFEGSCRAVEGLLAGVLHLVPRWRSVRWGGRFLGHYLRMVAGPGALLYFLLAGAVIGLVSTYFTFTFLPWRQYTEPLILDDLVAGLGFGLHRILVPLLMSILLAARAGAAVSADVATRIAGRQDEAMRTLGAEPRRYLLTGVLWAFLLGTPLLAVLSWLGARVASAGVFAVMAPDLSLHAWSGMFHRLLDAPGSLLPAHSDWVLGKDLCAAFGIAAVAWFTGSRPQRSPEEVARSVTLTVIRATLLVLVVNTVFALLEF